MSSPQQPQPQTHARRKRGILWRAMVLSRAKRRWRWALRAAIALPLIIIAAFVVLTHSPLTRMLILPRVAKATGLQVDADSIHIGLDGKVVMERAEFTIPGVPGEAGKFLKIAQVECTVDWWGAVGAVPIIGQVKMIDPVLILSESVEDGTLNVGRVPVPAGQKGGMQLPGIAATNLWVEVGEHGPGGYNRLKRIQMDGSLTPMADAPGVYSVALYEAAQRGRGSSGFHVGGTVSEGKINLNLINFSLTDWPPNTLPESIRDIAAGLALSGDVPKATFGYTLADGITASMELRGVAMNLPVDATVEGPVQPEGPVSLRPMRMSGVDGAITFARDSVVAKVGGLIEDLPYEVTLRYNGVDADSPFRLEFLSKDFLVSRNPELLVYAPPTVLYYLKTFLMPTGRLTTRVNIERGPPVKPPGSDQSQPGPITVSGSVDFSEGTAAYESFPYEFSDMSGRFEFDNQALRILNVSGRSKTGARLHARGSIAPLDESSEVDIHVTVNDAQIDEAMEVAFGPDRGAVISALFSERRHQELLDAELIRTPEQAKQESQELAAIQALPGDQAPADRLAELHRRARIPVFEFRGRADVAVHVYAPRGVGTAYQTSVDVFLPRAGLIPEKFPYPLIAESVGVEVRDQKGRLTQGSFRGISGGKARVQAEFSVPGKSDTEPPAPPDIQVRVADLPFDQFLLHALPGSDDGSGFKRIVRDMNVSAGLSGDIHIHQREGKEDLGFDAVVTLNDGEARPVHQQDSEGIALARLNASLEISERRMFLDIEGVPVRASPNDDAGLVGPRPPLLLPGIGQEDSRIGGTLTVHVRGSFPEQKEGSEPSYFIAGTCPSLDVGSDLECLLGLFSSDAAARMGEARAKFHPTGFVDVQGEADIAANASGVIKLSTGRSLAANVLGRRVSIAESGGTVLVSVGQDTRVKFESVAGPLVVARADSPGDPAGMVLMDGEFVQGEGSGSLHVALLDARFESELTRAILEQIQPAAPGNAESSPLSIIDRVKPSGAFDANIIIRSGEASSGPLVAQGRIEPRSLTIQPDEQRVEFKRVEGAIEFTPSGGTLNGLVLEAPEWSLRADGGWTGSPDSSGGIRFRSTLSVRGNKLADDLKAVMPVELRTLFSDLKMAINGPFELTGGVLDVDRAGKGSVASPAARFSGNLAFKGAALEAGVPITDMDGSLRIQFQGAAGSRPPAFELDPLANRFLVSGVPLTRGAATIRSGPAAGQVRITQALGECHGGRFSVRAEVLPEADTRRVNAEFQLSGVRFNTLLREVNNSIKPMVGPPSPQELEERDAMFDPARRREDFSRGLLDAELSLTTLASDPKSRRGRGTMRISGGRVLNLPVMTGLIEAMNLALPFNASLDFAWASMFMEGQIITFEDLSVQSSSIELSGGGTLTMPDRELDLRLQSRAARPIPILSAILQGIRHTLVEATITGKLGEPVVGIQSPGPSRMIDGILGGRPDSGQDSQSQFGTERARDRDARRGIRPQKPTSGVSRDPARNAGVPA